MEALLEEFSLQFLLPELEEAGIGFKHLEYLNERDIADAIKKVGPRAEFREKLFKWRRNSFLKETCVNKYKFSEKTLADLLSSTDVGNSIQLFYKNNECLSSETRDKLINVILENTFINEKKLTPPDFMLILEEICKEFPNEQQVSDYYYYPRIGKKAPGGKLFHRYHNYKAKNKKLEQTSLKSTLSGETDEDIDEHIKQLKQELFWPLQSWDNICDRWARTYSLRKEDIKNLDNFSFLKEWHVLKDARAIDLINIDFEIAYPGKKTQLIDKWALFKDDIIKFYSAKQLNQHSRELLKNALESNNEDFQNSILLNLLNAVLLPVGFGGKAFTILDAQEFFIVTVHNINNIDIKIEQLAEKCKSLGNSLQPLVIIEGLRSVQNFYTYFDGTFLKFESFLEAFDCAFKIFFVLNLKYPDLCIKVWTFVQKYFYEIHTTQDIRSASLSSFLNHMLKTNNLKCQIALSAKSVLNM